MSSAYVCSYEEEIHELEPLSRALSELRLYCVHVARQCGARDSAEDIAQDAMLALLVAEQVNQPHAWLRTVVRRLVSRRLRDRYLYASLDQIDCEGAPRPAGATDGRVLLRQVLRLLPARDRRILLLKLRGYSYSEMARRLGCKASAVGTLVNRAFARGRRVAHG